MVRINLVPAEILERRKYERYYPWVFAAGGLMLAVVLVIWLSAQFLVAQATVELQQTQELVTDLQTQADAFAVFEERETQLADRVQVSISARQGMVDMGALAEDLTLVLPEEVWLSNITANELNGLQLSGYTPDSGDENTIHVGYKSVAAMLVRLNSLPALLDVWLGRASFEDYEFEGTDAEPAPAVAFDASSKIATTSPAPTAASPAPPSPTPSQ